MTGLHDTDIRLDEDGQLTQAADGDAPLCSGMDCFLQSIILEDVYKRQLQQALQRLCPALQTKLSGCGGVSLHFQKHRN